jgi:hypothetical protein
LWFGFVHAFKLTIYAGKCELKNFRLHRFQQ